MSLDGDDAFAGNIFDSVVRTHSETGANIVQFEMWRSLNGGPMIPFLCHKGQKDVFDNEELRREVIAGKITWSVCLVSIERELYILAIDILSKRFNRSLYWEEDRLQMYVIFHFTRKLVFLRQWGYSYFQIEHRWTLAQRKAMGRDSSDIHSFLMSLYNHSGMYFR
jgi:hypothetical protein